MTDYYVSESATNGYVVGDDGNAGTSKAAPFLTIAAAVSASSTGDSIYINEGTYTGTELGATGYVAVTTKAVSLYADSGVVDLNGTNTTSTITFDNPGTGTFYVAGVNGGSFTLQGDNDTQFGIRLMNGTTYTAYISDVECIDPTIYGINVLSTQCNVYASDITLTSNTAATRSLFYAAVAAAGTISIDGATITLPNKTNSSTGVVQIFGTAASAVTASIKNVTGTIGLNAAATFRALWIKNCDGALIEDCTLTLNDAGGAPLGIAAVIDCDSGTLSAHNGRIQNVLAYMNTQGGFGVQYGHDASNAGDDRMDNGRIIDCNIVGSTAYKNNSGHALMFGYASSGRGYSNTTSDSAIGCLIKGGTGTHFAGGYHSGFTSVGGQLKGATNSSINNSIFLLDGSNGDALLANVNGAINNSGCEYNNNLVVAVDDTTGQYVSIGSSQDVALSLNAYHDLGGSLPTNLMSFQGTDYTTKAAYVAAVETDAIITDPDIDSNYHPNSGSPLVGTGTKWWTGPNPVGNDGEPFSDIDTDIGGIQSKHSPFHPVNL